MCFGDGGAGKIAKQQRADEDARQRRINSGIQSIDSTFSGFDDAFYGKRAQDYVDYAMPGVQHQASGAARALIYALARRGNLDSSAAIRKNSDLTREMDEARIGVVNQGLDLANRSRADVENIRSGLVSQINATGNDEAAAAAAVRQAQAINMPQGYSPLGAMFQDFIGGLSRIGSNDANNFSGFFGGGGSPLFRSKGSQRVVGAGG